MMDRILVNRGIEIAGFLAQNEWGEAQQADFAADFSPRRYARLTQPDGSTAILMDADPDQKTLSFLRIAKLLKSLGIAAPSIITADPMRGLVLMEDFGDRNIGKLLDEGVDAKIFYRRATDLLIRLHQTFDLAASQDIDLPVFDSVLFTAQAELFLDAYIPFKLDREATDTERQDFRTAWREVLRNVEKLPRSLLLRDFMPDNLMDLTDRADGTNIGVLDFQDAGIGSIAYDLASLCENVRRDGGVAMLDDVLAHYHSEMKPAFSLADLKQACHILAAQRHVRVLGIIARLAQTTGRREKLAYMSRIWAYLDFLLQDDALKPVRVWIKGLNLNG